MPNLKFEQNWVKPASRPILMANHDVEVQILAITVSALLHLVLFFLVHQNFSGVFSNPKNNETPRILAIKLLPEKELNQRQITSDSEQVNKINPKQTYKEAEQNNSILEESIKRGDGGAPSKSSTTKKSTPKTKITKQVVAPEQKKQDQKQINKALSEPLNKKNIATPKLEKPLPPTKQTFDLKTQTQNNLDSALAGSLFAGQGGSPDLLPNVREGEITLLNTKASKYAVFVRRVALQVFNDLKNQAWKQLNYQEIQKILGNATVIAKLDPQGNLVSTKLVSNSGSETFNQLIHNSVKEKARDPHPPESALVDGQFHFIFQTKMTSAMSPSRGGGYAERRWLILSVGLD